MNVKCAGLMIVGLVAVLCGCETNTATTPTRSAQPSHADSVADAGSQAAAIYTVADYDPAADPASDLIATIAQASGTGKRIILEVGGQW